MVYQADCEHKVERFENLSDVSRCAPLRSQIPNACGSIGLLHSLLNLPTSVPISNDSALARFRAESLPLDPTARAKLLDETSFFEQAHKAAADSGQSSVPQTAEELDVDLHFISFVPAKGADG